MKHVRDLTKYITKNDKILVVSPHPDDEVLGCGGLIAKYGKQIDILLLTNGEDNEEAKNIRLNEYDSALRMSGGGLNKTILLNIPLYEIKKNYKKLEASI